MKRILIEAGICLVCIVTSIVCVRCANVRADKAQEEAETALRDAEAASAMFQQAEAEKRELQALMAKYNETLIRAAKAVDVALENARERNEKIDDLDDDWLAQPLPDGVCDAFADYTDRNGFAASAGSTAASMCPPDDDGVADQ